MDHRNQDQGMPQPQGGEDDKWMNDLFDFNSATQPPEPSIEQSIALMLSQEALPATTLSFQNNDVPMFMDQPYAAAIGPQTSVDQVDQSAGRPGFDYKAFPPPFIPTSDTGFLNPPGSVFPSQPGNGYEPTQVYCDNTNEQSLLAGTGQGLAPGGIFSPLSTANVSPRHMTNLSPGGPAHSPFGDVANSSYGSADFFYGSANAQSLGQQPLPPMTQPMQFNQEFIPNDDYGMNLNKPQQSYLSPPEVNARVGQGSVKDPESKTGTYLGFARNQADAKRLFAQYLARNNTDKGSLQGFPQDDAGQRQLVRQAVEAMVQLEGSHEAQEVATGTGRKNTSYSRIAEHHWTDEELEIMAWQVLEACKDVQLGNCRVPEWFGDKRLAARSEYCTFTDRWVAVMEQLKVGASHQVSPTSPLLTTMCRCPRRRSMPYLIPPLLTGSLGMLMVKARYAFNLSSYRSLFLVPLDIDFD